MEYEEDELPVRFLCPITQEIMNEPVMDKEGNNFEKKAIIEYLKKLAQEKKPTISPLSRQSLTIADLRPNLALKEEIDEKRQSLQAHRKPDASRSKSGDADAPEMPTYFFQASTELDVHGHYSQGKGLLHLSIGVKGEAMEEEVQAVAPLNPSFQRSPVVLCCVIDTSGSMGTPASIKMGSAVLNSNAGGDTAEAMDCGLSYLSICQHVLRTLIASLDEKDHFSLVSFSDHARVVFPLKQMNAAAKKDCLAKVDLLKPDGQTNLWDGLKTGMNVLGFEAEKRTGNPALFLLTDGVPNVPPPGKTHGAALKDFIKAKGLPATVSIFGFGYQLESSLLAEMAEQGQGSFFFIPDSSLMASIFINSLSQALTTAARSIQLQLTATDKTKMEVMDLLDQNGTSGLASWIWGDDKTKINVGSVCYGQTRDIIISLPSKPKILNLEVIMLYNTANQAGMSQKLSMKLNGTEDVDAAQDQLLVNQLYRLKAVQAIDSALNFGVIKDLDEARKTIQQLMKEMMPYTKKSPYLKELLLDLSGQVSEAISKEAWFSKWGQHYLQSLTSAHRIQHCNNFKDPGVQQYAGPDFLKAQQLVNSCYFSISLPKNASVKSEQRLQQTIQMLNNSSSTCMDGNCLVTMMDGSLRCVKDLKRGDMVQTTNLDLTIPNKNFAKITCIIKNVFPSGKTNLVTFSGGLKLTPWHPIRLAGQAEFTFPIDHHQPIESATEGVYSFALDQGHVMIINGVEVISLAHGSERGILKHELFGTDRILEDLKHFPEYYEDSGVITVTGKNILMDPQTSQISHLIL